MSRFRPRQSPSWHAAQVLSHVFALACSLLIARVAVAGAADPYVFDNVPIGPLGFIDSIVAEARSHELVNRTDVAGADRWDEARATWFPITDFLIQQESGRVVDRTQRHRRGSGDPAPH